MTQAYTVLDAGELELDPAIHPELYDGVRSRRIMAFVFDAILILVLMAVAFIVVTVLGILTLGLGWFLHALIWPAVPVLYSILTLGSRASATPGMRFCGIEMRSAGDRPVHMAQALVSVLGFWFSVSFLTPFILLVSLFNGRKRLLHDMVSDTVVVRSRRW